MIDSPEAFPVLASRTSENRSLVVMTHDACICIVFVFAFASDLYLYLYLIHVRNCRIMLATEESTLHPFVRFPKCQEQVGWGTWP